MSEDEKRAALVAEARSWIGTPYIVRGRVKGAGCDCGSFLMSVAVNCGLMADEQMEVYSADCWMHWKDGKYLRHVMRHSVSIVRAIAFRIPANITIKPGMLLLTQTRNCKFANHGAIVTEWPMGVHATGNFGVHETDLRMHTLWRNSAVEAFDFKEIYV